MIIVRGDNFVSFCFAFFCNVDRYIIVGRVNIIFTPKIPPAMDARTEMSVSRVVIRPTISTSNAAILLISAITGILVLAISTNLFLNAMNINGVLVRIEVPIAILEMIPSGSLDAKLLSR